MLIHAVYLWLKEESDAALRAEFAADCRALLAIPHIAQGWVGTPASTRDQVIDHSYEQALMLHFADLAAHDAYQEHPLHHAFVARYLPHFAQVKVYDMESA
ncbi:Dabb family protein [Massilia sp. W12]|uniref:Dabb family protein n=1 Tax=Massilia sp. W12 TaxID=3126507 RepID=UPI0030D52D5F